MFNLIYPKFYVIFIKPAVNSFMVCTTAQIAKSVSNPKAGGERMHRNNDPWLLFKPLVKVTVGKRQGSLQTW